MELDDNIGRIMDEIRSDARPNRIITADNGAWQDAWPDAGTVPFRRERALPLKEVFASPAGCGGPGIFLGVRYDEMMSHIDCWSTLAAMAGLTPPPHGAWKDNNGKPIYMDSIDNSAYILGKAKHSARKSWVYINGETLGAVRADIGDDPDNPGLNIAWKYMYTARIDGWAEQNPGGIGALYNLTMDPFEKYDMVLNGAVSYRALRTSPGGSTGMDNGWVLSLVQPVTMEFDKWMVDFPNDQRFPGGASNDQIPNLQNPDNPVPNLDFNSKTLSMPD